MPELSAFALRQARALRFMSQASKEMGAAWFSDAALEARPSRAPLYPFTESGRRAYSVRDTAPAEFVALLLERAEAESAKLIRHLEAEARAALEVADRPAGSSFGDTLYMGDDFS